MKKYILLVVIGTLIISGFGAGGINVDNEKIISNPSSRDYTHTVLVEVGTRTTCSACPLSNLAWHSIYGGGNYDFEYIELVYNMNTKANQRFSQFNPAWVPTSYFDGGEYVCVGTNYNTFYNYLDSSGSRTVPDLDAELSAMWLGNAKIDISLSIENNDNNDYPGTLRVYIIELESPRWNDYDGNTYYHAFLDFPWNQAIDIDSGDTFEDSKVWDGAAAGYADIDPDNIQVILSVFDDTPYTSYSDPPSGNPFNAYYADETVAAIPEVGENNPPEIPEIDGTTSGNAGTAYDYDFTAIDPDGDDVSYYIEWGDGQIEEWIGPYSSGQEATASHIWTSAGDYEIRAKAKDIYDAESEWSDVYLVTIVENEPPEAPDITGQTSGKTGTEYEYTFNAVDPDGDNVKYYIEWGDGDSEETDFSPSGTDVKVKHTWIEEGDYPIKAKAEDTTGLAGPWGTLTVTMPRNRAINTPFMQFLEQYPILYQLLLRFLRL